MQIPTCMQHFSKSYIGKCSTSCRHGDSLSVQILISEKLVEGDCVCLQDDLMNIFFKLKKMVSTKSIPIGIFLSEILNITSFPKATDLLLLLSLLFIQVQCNSNNYLCNFF